MSDNINNTNPPEEPITREEKYLSAIAGTTGPSEIPEVPKTRVEKYLNKIVENGTGGGGGGGGATSYNSLDDKPSIAGVQLKGDKALSDFGIAAAEDIPTVNNSTITIQKNGTTVDSFTTNSASGNTINITVPTTAADVSAIPSTAKGAANGVAELDSNGLVPSSQLPSYVDDVLEYSSFSAFPTTGQTGKIYIDLSSNKTYRWSGTGYVEISKSLALGETSSTAYRGDRGKTAYSHATDSSRITTAKSSGLYKMSITSEGHIASAETVQKSDITGLGIQEKINSGNMLAASLSNLTGWQAGSASTHTNVTASDTVLEALQKIDNNQRNDETNILLNGLQVCAQWKNTKQAETYAMSLTDFVRDTAVGVTMGTYLVLIQSFAQNSIGIYTVSFNNDNNIASTVNTIIALGSISTLTINTDREIEIPLISSTFGAKVTIYALT